jgi:hypothetical protein
MLRAASFVLSGLLFLLLAATTHAGGDIAPPTFIDATPIRPHIDTSRAAQTITFTAHFTDDLSGVEWVFMRWVNEHGYNAERDCYWQPSAAPVLDAIVPCAVTFPRYSAEGRWLLNIIGARDAVGNRLEFYVSREYYEDGHIAGYAYTPEATEAMKAVEIVIGDPPQATNWLYAPALAR